MIDKNTDERDTMIVYRSFYEAIRQLPKENQAEVWEAVFEYGLNFNELELTGISKVIFTLIKPIIEANIKRFINGKKPKSKQSASEIEANPKQDVSEIEANKDVNKDNDKNEEVLSPTPSSAKPQKATKTPRVKKAKPTRLEVEQFYKSEIESIPLFSLEKEFAETAAGRGITVDLLGEAYKDFVGYMTNPSDKWPQGMWRCVLTKPDQLSLHQYSMLVLKYGMKRDEIKAYADSWENRKYDNDNLYASFTSWRDNERKRESSSGASTESTGKGLSVPKKVTQ